jgi:hypothetical protein
MNLIFKIFLISTSFLYVHSSDLLIKHAPSINLVQAHLDLYTSLERAGMPGDNAIIRKIVFPPTAMQGHALQANSIQDLILGYMGDDAKPVVRIKNALRVLANKLSNRENNNNVHPDHAYITDLLLLSKDPEQAFVQSEKSDALALVLQDLNKKNPFSYNKTSFLSAHQQILTREILSNDLLLEGFADNTVIQLHVRRQGEKDGAASCGYQSLLNGILVARFLLSNQEQKQVLSYLFKNEALRINLFGEQHSKWRQFIIGYRTKYLISKFIYNVLLCNLWDELALNNRFLDKPVIGASALSICDQMDMPEQWIGFTPCSGDMSDRERDKFKNILTASTENIVEKLYREGKITVYQNKIIIGKQYIIEGIYAALETKRQYASQQIQRVDQKSKSAFEQEAKQYADLKNKIDLYFPQLENVQIILSDSKIEEAITGFSVNTDNWKRYITGGLDSKPGEWLGDTEIQPLVIFEKAQGFLLHRINLQQANFGITFVSAPTNNNIALETVLKTADVVLDEKGEQQAAAYHFNDNIKELMQIVRDVNTQAIRIILLRIPGHWITCIVNKIKNQKAQYIITDSLEIGRIQHQRVKELITLLEGTELAGYVPARQDTGGGCVIA